MVDPAVQELYKKYSWVLPASFFVGLLIIYLERKIDQYKRKRRNKK